MTARRDLGFAALGFLPAAIGYGLIPLLPVLLASFARVGDREAGNIIALWLMLTSLAQMPAQHLLRRYGPNRVVLFTGASATMLFPLAMLAENMVVVHAAYGMGAIGAALLALQATALCEAEREGRARAFSFLQAGANASAIVAPAAAVLLAGLNPIGVLLALALARTCVSFAVTTMLIARTRSRPLQPKRKVVPAWPVLLSPRVALIMVIGMLFSFLYAQLLYTSQIIVDAQVFGLRIAPLIISLNAGLILVFQPFFLQIEKRASTSTLLLTGCAFALASWVALAVSPGAAGLVAMIVLFTAAEVFLMPASMALIGESVHPDAKLFAYACYTMTRLTGSLGVVIGVAVAVSSGPGAFAFTMCLVAVTMLGAGCWLARTEQSERRAAAQVDHRNTGETT